MRRAEFTPHTWRSDDGKWTFRMDKYGFTDILPGSNHPLLSRLKASHNHSDKVIKRPYHSGMQHIHWAAAKDLG